jgi:sulfate adenylyltransferase subunit 1 (EFTu-like GTPase family)
LLGIPHVIAAVNKMDLVRYDQSVFDAIKSEFADILDKLGCRNSTFLPLSALTGENVVKRGVKMLWFTGPSLLEHLENVEVEIASSTAPFRLPVQYVIRPNQEFRGYAGQIASGSVHPGQEVTVLPSGLRTRVKTIAGFEADLESAHAPMSVTLTLEDEVDISRGDLLAGHDEIPNVGRSFEAEVVWMSETPVQLSRPLLLKHTTQTVRAEIREVEFRINLGSLDPEPAETLGFNDIGRIRIETAKPLYFDSYRLNRITGSFILIDPATNATIAAGMILHAVAHESRSCDPEPVTTAERMDRHGHYGAVVRFGTRIAVGQALERRLFDDGCAVILLPEGAADAVAEELHCHGFLVLQPGEVGFDLPSNDLDAVSVLYSRLERDGVFVGTAKRNQEQP